MSISGSVAGFAAELSTSETTGSPISPVQVQALGAATVQEQAPTSTLTPLHLGVLTPRMKMATVRRPHQPGPPVWNLLADTCIAAEVMPDDRHLPDRPSGHEHVVSPDKEADPIPAIATLPYRGFMCPWFVDLRRLSHSPPEVPEQYLRQQSCPSATWPLR